MTVTLNKGKNMTDNSVPKALKTWFIIHFILDILFAVPLFIFPEGFLGLLGWHSVDPFATRLVAAALFGIGIESFLGRNASAETYKNMLTLKIIWSGTAILGIALSIFQNAYTTTIVEWLLLAIFLGFNILWFYWRARICKSF